MPARTPERLPVDLASPPHFWAGGAMAWQPLLIAMLDTQTAWCKDAERWTAHFMQAWLGSMALQPAWAAWTQVWVNALQHDAGER